MAKSKKVQTLASPVPVTVTLPGGEQQMYAAPKTFKSGNIGWWGQQRFTMPDGTTASVQVTIVHKEAKEVE